MAIETAGKGFETALRDASDAPMGVGSAQTPERATGPQIRLGLEWTHRWHWRRYRPDRKGQPCRVIATGALNSALVEFQDGERVVTVRYAVRRARAGYADPA